MSDLIFIEPDRSRLNQSATWSFVLSIAGIVVLLRGYLGDEFGLVIAGLLAMANAMVLGLIAIRRHDRSDPLAGGVGLAYPGIAIAGVSLAVALLAPAYSSARHAARRAWSMNNLKQIGLALLNYESVEGRLPPAVVYSPEGRPLYSWRVLILPYMEGKDLFDAFNLAEAWDGPTNRTLLARRPRPFAPVGGDNIDPTLTHAQVFNGPGAAFDDRRGEPLRGFTDPGQTILVVEAMVPVAWTRPIDLPFSEVGQLPPLGRVQKGRSRLAESKLHEPSIALFADGSVKTLDPSWSETTLRTLITRKDVEPIEPEGFP